MFDSQEPGMPVPSSSRGLAAMNITPTMTERSKREQENLTAKLLEVNAALKAIEENPSVQLVVDALTKLHWLQ